MSAFWIGVKIPCPPPPRRGPVDWALVLFLRMKMLVTTSAWQPMRRVLWSAAWHWPCRVRLKGRPNAPSGSGNLSLGRCKQLLGECCKLGIALEVWTHLPWNCRRAWVGRNFKDHLLWAGTPSTRAGCSLNTSRDEAAKSFSGHLSSWILVSLV